MGIKNFIENFASQFDDIDNNKFEPETKFREIEGWSSLIALSIMAMIDEEYGISIKGDDIRKSQTIIDLYNIVKTKL